MKTPRCRPGQVCVIIGEVEGCEANIGAMITVIELQNMPMLDPVWSFKDASRPLVTTCPPVTVVNFDDIPDDFCFIYDHHLLPVEGDLGVLEIHEELEINS